MEFGIVGLGKMGTDLALQSVGKGIRVVGSDPGIGYVDCGTSGGLQGARQMW